MYKTLLFKIFALLLALLAQRVSAQEAFLLLGEITKKYEEAQGLCIEYTRELRTRSMSMLGGEAKGDLAKGKIYVMPPHYMRLEQKSPREELIITEGKNLWWYIPEEKKAYLYPAERFGKQMRLIGEILSPSSEIGKKFKARLVEPASKENWVIELIPLQPWEELDHLLVHITKTKEIVGLEMVSPLGSRTIFQFRKIEQAPYLDHGRFQFTLPEGVKLIREE